MYRPGVRVVGLDLGLGATGVAGPGGVLTVRPSPKLRGPARLCSLRDTLVRLTSPGPDTLCVVEGYSYGSKGRSIFEIGELGGVVRCALWDAGASILVVPPSVVKLYATGSGNKPKEFVWEAARRREPLVETKDEADAWWLRQIGLRLVGADDVAAVPVRNLAALDKLPSVLAPSGPVAVAR